MLNFSFIQLVLSAVSCLSLNQSLTLMGKNEYILGLRYKYLHINLRFVNVLVLARLVKLIILTVVVDLLIETFWLIEIGFPF